MEVLTFWAAATAGFTFLPSLYRTRGGGALFLRPSRDRTRTTASEVEVEAKNGSACPNGEESGARVSA